MKHYKKNTGSRQVPATQVSCGGGIGADGQEAPHLHRLDSCETSDAPSLQYHASLLYD